MDALVVMSPSDLEALVERAVRRALAAQTANTNDYVYGISGIADLFGVSKSAAQKMKATGILDGAISQRGRTIVVRRDKAIELWANAN